MGILVAVGVFAWISYDAEIGVKVKGEWQLDFLRNYYVEGEEKLANIDQQALFAGNKVILSLAEKGGSAESSECGLEDGFYYWNNGDAFCFLEVDKEVNIFFNKVFQEQYGPGQNYVVSHQGNELVGKAEKDLMVSSRGTQYSLKPHFRVNLGYNFDEYFLLQDEARKLVNECKSAENIQDCLEKVKPPYWNFGSCENELFFEQEQKVAFCVDSPQKYAVFENGKFVPVRYKLGLDFGTN